MSAAVTPFPSARIIRRPPAAGPGVCTCHCADPTADFWAAALDADAELQRRLKAAETACERAADVSARAQAVLERAAKRRRDLRQVCDLLLIVAMAGAAAALVVFGLGL